MKCRAAALAFLAVVVCACVGVGPRAIRAERFNYNEAVIRTWNEQLLLNLVRLRYRDTPYFLEVTSVSTQYEVGGTLGASAKIVAGGGNDEAGAGAGVTYVERPTVIYSPLTGEAFVKRMLSPMPMESLLLLSASGWRTDRVLRCGVARINDVWNAPTASGPTPEEAPDYETFGELSALLLRLQRAHAMELISTAEGLVVRFVPDRAPPGTIDRVRELLGLPAGPDRFRMATARRDTNAGGILVVPRSLIGMMFYLSQAVEPPARDVETGRVTRSRGRDGAEFDWARVMDGMFRVRSSDEPPEGAFVRVHYRGAWFFIDDADLESKTTFGLVAQIFNLVAGDTRGGGPLLTLPLGG